MAGNAILITVDATTAQFDRAMSAADKTLLRYSSQLKLAQKAQAEFDATVAASGASSAEAAAAQGRLGAALARTTVAEQRAAVAAKAAGEIQAQAAAKAAAAQEAAAAKQVAAQRKLGTVFGTVGLAAAAALGLAAKAAADFDAKMAQVQSLTRANAADMAKLTEATKGFANIGASASDAADAEIELVKAGISVKDITGGALTGALNLAAAGQVDFGTATSIAAAAMTEFQLSGKDIPHLADLLAAGADRALGSVQDLGTGMTYVGLGAHQLGISVDDTVAALSEFANAGLIGSQGGTTLQQVLRQLTGPTNAAALEIQELGLNLYDASGKFVGLASVAGQLHDKLGGMSQQQRDLALNTLFTSRAVRGATILYQDGAAGVESWQKKVQASGFAAEQAAGKMDSLQGDMEKLRAEVTNAAIDFGQKLQPALRDITQAVTDVVQVFDDLPEPVKQLAANMTVAVAALGLGVFAFTRLKGAASGLARLLGAVTVGEVAAGDAAGVMSVKSSLAANKMLLIRGGALLAGVALDTFSSKIAHGSNTLDALVTGLGDAAIGFAIGGPIGAGLGFLAGEFTKTKTAGDGLLATASNLDGAMAKLADATKGSAFNIKAQADAIKGLSTQANQYLADQGKAASEATSSWNPVTIIKDMGQVDWDYLFNNGEAQRAFDQLHSGSMELFKMGDEFSRLNNLLHGVGENSFKYIVNGVGQLQHVANDVVPKLQKLGYSIKEIRSLMETPSGRKTLADALIGSEGGLTHVAGQIDTVTNSMDRFQRAAHSAWADEVKFANALLERRSDYRGYQAAIDDAAAALKKNGRTLDENTAKGRENADALDQQTTNAIKFAGRLHDPILKMNFLQESRAQLVKTAMSFGDTKKEAEDYVNKMLAIPKDVRTAAAFEKNQAYNDIQTYKAAIDSVQGFKNTTVTAHTEQAEAALTHVISLESGIQSKTVWVTVGTRYVHSGVQVQPASGGYISGGQLHRYARGGTVPDGGYVRGPGTGTSDSIPAMISNGEFVVKAAAVSYYGVGYMHAVNQMRAPQQFAAGGAASFRSPPPVGRVTQSAGIDGALVAAVNAVTREVAAVKSALSGVLDVNAVNAADIAGYTGQATKGKIQQYASLALQQTRAVANG